MDSVISDGQKGRQGSRNFTLILTLSFMSGSQGFDRIDLCPKALAPNSRTGDTVMRTLSTALVLGAFIAASFILVGPKEQAYAGEVDVSADMLDDLEDGLRSSDAIGIAAKLSLRARIDSLVTNFAIFITGRANSLFRLLKPSSKASS